MSVELDGNVGNRRGAESPCRSHPLNLLPLFYNFKI
jgi:hypothetical protein